MRQIEKWKMTSYQVHPDLIRPWDTFLASKNLTGTKVFNALFIALIRGDILMDVVPEGSCRMFGSLVSGVDAAVEGANFRDKQGNLLNTSKFDRI